MATNGQSELCCANGDLLPPNTKRPAMMNGEINGACNGAVMATTPASSNINISNKMESEQTCSD